MTKDLTGPVREFGPCASPPNQPIDFFYPPAAANERPQCCTISASVQTQFINIRKTDFCPKNTRSEGPVYTISAHLRLDMA